MINPQVNHNVLLVQKDNAEDVSGFNVVPMRQLQDAIDYIIHYNPVIVIVDKSMTDAALMKIRRSVKPWFSGKIFKDDEQ